jgi:predicted transcriptional regulator YheO
MKTDEEIRRKLNTYIPLTKFLARFLGRHYEVVLHDVRDIEHSIVAIENNHISGRSVGDPLKNLGRFFREQEKVSADLIKPRIVVDAKGRKRKTSTHIIKDEDGDVVGLLCINTDLSRFAELKDILDDYVLGPGLVPQSEPELVNTSEGEDDSIEDLTRSIIKDTIRSSPVPPSRMTPEEKMIIVEKLNGRGVFLLRGALGEVARLLETSENSIYRYLSKLTNNGGKASATHS